MERATIRGVVVINPILHLSIFALYCNQFRKTENDLDRVHATSNVLRNMPTVMGSFHMDWAMKGSVLILMLCVLLADTTLGLDLSLAPGLSVTNAFLYLIIVAYFIETAVLRYLEREEYVDEFEMKEIKGNRSLNASIKRGLADAKAGRGRVA